MKAIIPGIALSVLGLAFTLTLPMGESLASSGMKCAKREMVATGSSVIHQRIAKIDAEFAWELKVINKYGLLWYSWWAADNNRFICKTRGKRTTCIARGKPCRLL